MLQRLYISIGITLVLLLNMGCQVLSQSTGDHPRDRADRAAKLALATSLEVSRDSVTISSRESVDWGNSCLGITIEDRACAEVITPGYKYVLTAEDLSYQVHTDLAGTVVGLAKAPGQTTNLAVQWSRVGGIAGFCDEMRVYMTGDVFINFCGDTQPAPATHYLLSPQQLRQFYRWANDYMDFEIVQDDPAGTDALTTSLAFHGGGGRIATQAFQRSILHSIDEVFTGFNPDPGEIE